MLFGLLAQATDYSQELQDLQNSAQQAQDAYAQSAATAAAAAKTGLALGAGFLAFIWIYSLICLAFFVWWIILIIDLSKRDFPEKTTWMIILIVGLVIGLVWLVDLLYYFMVVKKPSNGNKPAAPATPSEPAK
jgi:hypothetical protein